jgi:tetratricopeptide (TPR) repeat protein
MISPLFAQAQALHQRSQFREAEQAYRQLLAAEPGNFLAWHWLAVLCYQQQRGGEALAAVEAALEIAPQAADALMLKGALLQAAGRPQEARDAMARAASLKPGNAESWYNLGLVEMDLQSLDAAVAAFDRALALQPNPQTWHYRGLALQGLQRPAEALDSFERTLTLAPGALPSVFARGEMLLQLGRNQEAITAFDQLLAQDPALVEAWNNRGTAQRRLKQFGGSFESYDRAAKLRPELASSWRNRGGALWGLRRFAEAAASYDKAVALAPDHVQTWLSRYAVLSALKRHDQALASLDKALALEPGNEKALLARGRCLSESGRVDEGLAVFRDHALRTQSGKDFSAPGDVAHKQRHDEEQRVYLAAQGISDGKYHLAEGARIAGPAVNPNATAQVQWQQSTPKLVVMDDFLTPAALDGLRRYCLASTFWQDSHADGYLGAFTRHGFGCPLLAQIAEELQTLFPAIFSGHGLGFLWGFKYDSSLAGINIHADEAAVNVNFWITPDAANLDPAHGGLVVWDVTAPLDWSYDQYNGDAPATRQFLADTGAKPHTVPYRANRAVIFDSDLFHETDVLAFKPGYENRRINITMLFGRRVATDT